MPDPTEKMLVLAARLEERTERGEVPWTLSEYWPGTVFQTEVGGQLITIRSRDDDGNHPFVFGLWQVDRDQNPFGPPALRQIEAISTINAMLASPSAEPTGVAKTLERLYKSARSRALKIDESIDAVLLALDQDPSATR
jgi:hypothetical protein